MSRGDGGAASITIPCLPTHPLPPHKHYHHNPSTSTSPLSPREKKQKKLLCGPAAAAQPALSLRLSQAWGCAQRLADAVLLRADGTAPHGRARFVSSLPVCQRVSLNLPKSQANRWDTANWGPCKARFVVKGGSLSLQLQRPDFCIRPYAADAGDDWPTRRLQNVLLGS